VREVKENKEDKNCDIAEIDWKKPKANYKREKRYQA
jgi:hypothetical protein